MKKDDEDIFSTSYNLYLELNVLLKILYYNLLKSDIEKVPKIIGTLRKFDSIFLFIYE